jgi:hypothetical protein
MVRLPAIPILRWRQTVVAVFAFERDARHALRLVDATGDIDARFCMHQVDNEYGEVELVMLETRVRSRREAQRLEILMQGANGILVIPDAVTTADRSRRRGSGRRRSRPMPHSALTSSG